MITAGSDDSLELSLNELLRRAEFDWHGVRLAKPDWADDSHSIACTIRSTPLQLPLWLHVMINAYWEALELDLPPIPAASLTGWWRLIDTARESPEDITDASAAPLVRETQYRVAPRSVAVLFARTGDTPSQRKACRQQNVTDSHSAYRPTNPAKGAGCAMAALENEPETRAALELIFSEHFSRDEPGIFAPLRDTLLTHGDHYMHLADLKSYLEADQRLRRCTPTATPGRARRS